MAAGDKLWFELGVRDEISSVLENLMRNSEKLANLLSDDTNELKNVYKNIVDISNVYDKIYIAQKRIKDTKGLSLSADQKRGLKDMEKELENTRKEFSKLFKDPDKLLEKGTALFDKMRTNIELMVKSTLRYVDNIETKERAEATNAANEERRVDNLKAKYYELQRQRQELANAIANAAPGTDLTSANALYGSLSQKMGLVKIAQRNGSGMPSSLVGADADEFFRSVRQEIISLTTATNAYNNTLSKNEAIQKSLQRLIDSSKSDNEVNLIKRKRIEYAALETKIRQIEDLKKRVEDEKTGLTSGVISTPTYTNDKIAEELDRIQFRYNEAVARGHQIEKDDAQAKKQSTEATRKKAEAINMLAHMNQNLVSSYNRIAEAGTKANNITIQLQNQLAGYTGLYGLERMVKSIITIGGQFEFQHIALQNILGDLQQANTLFAQLQTMAVESPKTFMELTTYVKQLSAYQIPYEELYDTTKRLADISTGLGVDMSRLILAYGQVRSAAVLRGQELRQFTEAGIPLVQKLAEKFTELNGKVVTTGDVFELISKRAVPFKMIKEILWDMTDEGGQFFDMQSKLADTLYGKYQKLQDSWQIMLGRIADGENIMGKTMKVFIEGIVGAVNALDTLMPALSMLAIGRLVKNGQSGFNKAYDKFTGNDAIRNMEIAKLKEVNRLERERIMNGRALNAEEQKLVATKNTLRSEEYYILAVERQITDYKAYQLMLEGKLTKQHFYKNLQMQGYTREQRKQIANGNLQALQGGGGLGKKIGAGLLNFVGGWTGAAITAIGVMMSLYQRAGQQAEQAAERAEASTNSMLKNLSSVNDLYNDLSNKTPGSTEEYNSAISRMTTVLKENGKYNEDIQKQIESTSSLSEQYTILLGKLQEVSAEYLEMKDNVKAYLEQANKAGQGNFITKIFNDTMEKDLGQWSEKNIAKNVAKKGVDRYGAAIRKEIENYLKSIKEWNEQTMRGMNWEDLYNLPVLGNNQRQVALGYQILNNVSKEAKNAIDNYKSAVQDLAGAESEVDSQMQEYSDHVAVALEDALSAQGVNIPESLLKMSDEDVKNLAEEDVRKVAKSIDDVVGSYNYDEQTKKKFKEKLYKWLLPEPLQVRVKALPIVKQSDLAPWQTELKDYFEKHKININVDAQSSLEKIEKDLQNKKEEWQQQMKRGGGILVSFGFDLSSLPDDINKVLSKVPVWMQNLVRKAFSDYTEGKTGVETIDQAGKDTGLNVNKKENKGNKEDKELNRWKKRVSLLEKYRKELEELEQIMPRAAAQARLREEKDFEALWSYFSQPNDYNASLDYVIKKLGTKGDRKEYVDELNSKKSAENLRVLKDNVKDAVSEMQRLLDIMSENYDVYKKWLELTGDAGLAGRVAGVTQNTSYADLLKELMQKELNKTNLALAPMDIFGLSETNAKKLGESTTIFKLWEEWQNNQKKLRKEQWDLYEEAYKGAKNYDDKIADVNRKLEKQIDAIEKLAQTDSERNYLVKNARKNALQEIGKLNWEKFKEENNWGEVFGDLENVSLEKLRKMIKAMREMRNITKLQVTEAKAWQEAMDKALNTESTKDSLGSIATAITNYNDAQKRLSVLESKEEGVRRGYYKDEFEDIEAFEKAIEQANNDIESSIKGLIKALKAFSKDLNSLSKTFESIGNNIGGSIGDILGGLGAVFGGIGNSIDAISSVDVNATGITAVIGRVNAVAAVFNAMVEMNKKLDSILPNSESLYEHYAEKAREINKLREAVDDYTIAVAEAQAQESEWFAGNDLSKLRANGNKAKEVLTSYYKELYEAQEAYKDKRSGLSKYGGAILGAIVGGIITVATWGSGGPLGVALGTAIAGAIGGTAATAIGAIIATGIGTAIGNIAQRATESIVYKDGQTSARGNMRIRTQHRSFWRSEKTQNLEEWVRKNLNAELFDKEGLVNIEAAQEVLEKYGDKLIGDTKETLEKLIELRKEYDEFIKQIEDYVSDIGTSLADNMTNAIWDWLSDGEDALDKFREYASDTWRSIAQDIVKTFMKISVLDKYSDLFKELFKGWSLGEISDDNLISSVATLAGAISSDFETALPIAERIATAIDEAFSAAGYDIKNSGNGSSSSSTSIKNISENTADLLASYMNAIRLDVSVNRQTLSAILTSVQAQKEMPTIAKAQLSELVKISAYTSQTATNTSMINEIYNILRQNVLGANQFNIK